MKLLRDRWLPIFQQIRQLEKDRVKIRGYLQKNPHEASMDADYRASEVMLSISETIVIPSDVILDLVHSIDRIDTIGWIHLPYPYCCIQFSHPIREKEIMAHVEINDLMRQNPGLNDTVQGLLIGNAQQDTNAFPPNHVFNMMNCCVLFASTSVNRVAWHGRDVPAEPSWEVSTFPPEETTPNQLDNKMRMIKLCYAINLFLNAPNVIIQRQKPNPTVNAKRSRKGKAILPEYHTVTIQKVKIQYTEINKGSGKKHTRMYPVRGHFRKLKQFDEPVWIKNHYRGVQFGEESMLKHHYRVPPKPSSPDGIDSSQA